MNCTYYSALGENDTDYLIARAVQFFAPGTPQVYYVGMLAGRNDIKLLEETKEGRNINRHYYTEEEISREVQRPVVKRLLELMRFRNSHPAFDGTFEVDGDDTKLQIRRCSKDQWALLEAEFAEKTYRITYTDKEGHIKIL